MESAPHSLEVESAIREIADTIRAYAGDATSIVTFASESVPPELRETIRLLKLSREAVGQMPPQPPTLRGRFGAWIVRQLRRALFWYTPPIQEFHRNVSYAFEQQAEIIAAFTRENNELRSRVGELESMLRSLDALAGTLGEDILSLQRKLLATSETHTALQSEIRRLDELQASLEDQKTRTGVLLERHRKGLSSVPAGELDAILSQEEHRLDRVYFEFENTFRGSREMIKDRLRVYLPMLHERGIGTRDMPLFDVGCGRGEWLELLAENGLEARGVDMNRVMVEQCLDFKLPAVEGDAVFCLREMKPNSLGGVSGFHIIECLTFENLTNLLDEIVRVLKPGGVALFETPNPANLRVGAERFYFDPTHRNPLPSPLSRFLLEQRGLTAVEVWELHPGPDLSLFPADGSLTVDRLNQLLCGAQDYAIIAWKASS
jgi:SAM-dependent methyltransferase